MEKLYPKRVGRGAFASRTPEECPYLYRQGFSRGHVLAERPTLEGQGTLFQSPLSRQLQAVKTQGDVERY
jgi:hypothetical protein